MQLKTFSLKTKPEVVAFDTECTGLKWSKNHALYCIGWAYRAINSEEFVAKSIEWPVNPITKEPIYSAYPKEINDEWLELYTDPDIVKVFANAKYDMHMIEKYIGIKPVGPVYDVLIAAWCCNTMEPSYALKDLAEKYVRISTEDQDKLREATRQARLKFKTSGFELSDSVDQDYWLVKFYDSSSKLLETYNKLDNVRTVQLWNFYEKGLKELGNWKAFEIEMELIKVLYDMEATGVRFFREECQIKLEELNKEITSLEEIIQTDLGTKLNINSPKQLQTVLYDKLNYPVYGYTKTGSRSTDTETLKKLYEFRKDSVLNNILKYRGYQNGRRYLENYLGCAVADKKISANDLIDLPHVYAIHPNFNQIAVEQGEFHGTRTGRLSASDPNLQNVADPAKSGGLYVTDGRAVFGPRQGYRWYCIDYSQLELRIFAERCGGKLLDAFLNGRDPHNETREAVPYLAAMPPERGRKIAKNTNFTIINCGGAGVLNKKYGVPTKEGEIIVSQFYDAYPETVKRQREAERFAIKNGYIETLFGRKINVDRTKEYGEYKYAYRATAYDVQGSAADIIKRAMIACYNYFQTLKDVDVKLLLSIHDELVFEIKEEHCYKWLLKKIKELMEYFPTIKIPIKCEIARTTTNWSSKEKREVVL